MKSNLRLIRVILGISCDIMQKFDNFHLKITKNYENCHWRTSRFWQVVKREITFKIDSRKFWSRPIIDAVFLWNFDNVNFMIWLFSWDTTQESLLSYFSQFGEVIDCVVMKNSGTSRSRGFGFVTFADPSKIDAVLARYLYFFSNFCPKQ